MTTASMTGYARAAGHAGNLTFVWEVKSVNGRGLEMRFRMPPGLDMLEPVCRQAVQEKVKRGNVQAALTVTRHAGPSGLKLNADMLTKVAEALEIVRARMDVAPPSADGILALRGVIESGDDDSDGETDARDAALVAGLREALVGLMAARKAEGKAIHAVLSGQIARIEELVGEARNASARAPELLKARLASQLVLLMEASPTLNPERLAQEQALLATRHDIREEIDRLTAHIAQARAILAGPEPAGRKLDFLSQEFNREANTLCSKSWDTGLTRTGIELKTVIDQFREQVANIE